MNKNGITLKNSAYLLPNLMTAFNLVCGLLAIIITLESLASTVATEKINLAAWFIVAAVVFDFLDGKVARLTHTESQFGVKIDSLTDFVSFGIAPMILAFATLLADLPSAIKFSSVTIFLFCGAWRLARFNSESIINKSSTHFSGLPIPAAAVFICSIVMVDKGPAESIAPKIIGRSFSTISPELMSLLAALILLGLSFLMVSRIPFPAFKRINRRNLIFLVGVFLFFTVISFLLPFENIVFLLMLLYLIVGLFQFFLETVIKQYTKASKSSLK